MKILRYNESIHKDNMGNEVSFNNDLLRYFAFNGHRNILIYEVLKMYMDMGETLMEVKLIYCYDFDSFIKEDGVSFLINFDEVSHEKILYTSNSLKEVKDMIPILLDSNKYNL